MNTEQKINSLERKIHALSCPLTVEQNKALWNSLQNINGITCSFFMDIGSVFDQIPFTITSIDNKKTNILGLASSTNKMYYPLGVPAYQLTGSDTDLSVLNGTGNYLEITSSNNINTKNLYGNNALPFNINTIISKVSINTLFEVIIRDYGVPLTPADPFIIEFINNTSLDITILLKNPHFSKFIDTTGIYTTTHFTETDEMDAFYQVNMTNEVQDIHITLSTSHIGAESVLASVDALVGNNYTFAMLSTLADYGFREFKIEINYI